MKTFPKILTHPNIPKPLHGTNPRTVMGKAWWDKERQKAYLSTDNRCIACGTHKEEADYFQWMEAHEYYKYNYKQLYLKLEKIVPLCHSCHNFIHSGRMFMLHQKGKMETEKIVDILERGLFILEMHQLKAFYGTLEIASQFGIKTKVKPMPIKLYDEENWDKWKIIINGKSYYSKFKNIDEWREYYDKID